MATREEILERQTFKEEGIELGQRVFYTLTQNQNAETKFIAKGLALLIVRLKEKNLVTDAEIDDLLFDTVT